MVSTSARRIGNEQHQSALKTVQNTQLNRLGRTRLTRELFSGRYRTGQSVDVSVFAAEYGLDQESALAIFAEFQSLGMVTVSNSDSAIIHSPNPKEVHEAYELRAALEEIAGRAAAKAMKGNTANLTQVNSR